MHREKVARNEIAQVVGPCWSQDKVLTALGVSADSLRSLRDAGAILALPTSDGALVYPVVQFQQEAGKVEVKPLLPPFITALRGFDPWAIAVLLRTPATELDGATPLEWLSIGGAAEPLARLAETVAREWSAGTRPP